MNELINCRDPIPTITFWDRLRILFVRPQVFWDYENRVVSKFKIKDGVVYLLRQEPIAHGDQRNYQIDSLYGPFTSTASGAEKVTE